MHDPIFDVIVDRMICVSQILKIIAAVIFLRSIVAGSNVCVQLKSVFTPHLFKIEHVITVGMFYAMVENLNCLSNKNRVKFFYTIFAC